MDNAEKWNRQEDSFQGSRFFFWAIGNPVPTMLNTKPQNIEYRTAECRREEWLSILN